LALKVFGIYSKHRLLCGLGALLVVEQLIRTTDRQQSLYLLAMLQFEVSNFLEYFGAGLVGAEGLVQPGGPPGDIGFVLSGVDFQDMAGLVDRLVIHSSSIEATGDHGSKLYAVPGVFAGPIQHLNRPGDIALSLSRVRGPHQRPAEVRVQIQRLLKLSVRLIFLVAKRIYFAKQIMV